MKKLMAMIGAVAMSFGLFADAYTISFEEAESEKGVDTSTMLFTPPVNAGEWAWAGDPLPFTAYGEEPTFEYGTGAFARRAGFDGDDANDNYLPLETGTDELARAMNGNIYLDQLVKFTGFEDPQTNLAQNTKIAIWMSEFEEEDESTTTNLYVTVGKVDDEGNVEQIALKIDPIAGSDGYELNTWYRLSIKSLGNVFGTSEEVAPHAGFLVYVNGQQVGSSDPDAKLLIATDGYMDGIAKGYMAEGQLFTAIDDTDATFASVGYQGIGAVDDIFIDAEGPKFCQTVDVVIPTVDGAEVDYVDVNGTHMQPPISVPDGTEITVYFKPTEGMKLTGDTSVTQTITSDENEIDVKDIVAEEVVATLTPAVGDATELAESELAAALAELGEDDVIETIAACEAGDDYKFSADTTITGTATGLNILVGEDGECALEVYADIVADEMLAIAFEDEYGTLTLGAESVAGTIEVANGTTTIAGDIALAEGAMIKAAAFDFESEYGTIALVEGAFVKSLDNTYDDTMITVPEEGDYELKVSEEPDEFEYYTYSAAQSGPEPTTDTVTFTVTYDDTQVENVTVTTNNGIAVELVGGVYTVESNAVVTVAATPMTGYQNVTIESDDVTVVDGVFTASKAEMEITITAEEIPADVAEIVGGGKYATLGEAIAALTGGETIKLLANYTTTENLAFNQTCTLDLNEKTLTIPGDYRGKPIAASSSSTAYTGVDAGATLTVTNGSVVLAQKNAGDAVNYGFYVVGKLINYANWTHNNSGGPAIELYEGAEVVQNDGVLYSGDIFRSKDSDGYVGTVTRTITINGGTMTATGNDTYHYPIVWFSKPGTCNLAINGGTFETAVYGSVGSVDEPTITGLDGSCQAKFKDTFLKVRDTETASGLSAYVAPGYEAVQGVDDYYTIQAIPTYTVAGITVANASVVATNKTAGGATFALPADLLRDTQIAVTVTPDTDYEYATTPAGWTKNENGSITTNATVTANLAITVEAPTKKAAPWPVDPEFPAEADEEVKAKYADWATTYGVTNPTGKSDNFLMNVGPEATVPTLEIQEISVEGTTATITVGTDATEFDLGSINGVLYVESTDELAGEWEVEQYDLPTGDVDQTATFMVTAGKFMRAKVGFKAPPQEPVTEP